MLTGIVPIDIWNVRDLSHDAFLKVTTNVLLCVTESAYITVELNDCRCLLEA